MLFKDGAINDASATATSFITDLTGVDNNFYKGQIMAFTGGNLVGQGRVVDTSNGSTGAVTLLDGYTQAPADTDTFLMMITHLHSSEEIADSVWDEATSGHTTAGSTAKALTDALADTNELQGDWTNGGRLDLLLDALITELDTATGEPGQEAPGVSIKRGKKIDYLYKAFRNRGTQTATEQKVYADDGTTVDQKATISDDGTTYDKGEFGTGP